MKIRIRKSDQLFSKYLRYKASNRCAVCFKISESAQASHFYGRRNENVRFDTDNVDCFCFFCHQKLGSNPEDYREWKLKQLGKKRYEALKIRSNIIKKRDDKLDTIYAQSLLDSLD